MGKIIASYWPFQEGDWAEVISLFLQARVLFKV